MTPTYSFREFIELYDSGEIQNDASWRAYDIGAMSSNTHVRAALKVLRYRVSKELELSCARIAADYQIATPMRANYLLGLWYVWRSIAQGQRTRKLLPRINVNDTGLRDTR